MTTGKSFESSCVMNGNYLGINLENVWNERILSIESFTESFRIAKYFSLNAKLSEETTWRIVVSS